MKKIYSLFILGLLFFCLSQSAFSQATRIVRVPGWDPAGADPIDNFNNVLSKAIDADTTERKTNPNVIFELVRGHQYPQGVVIKNYTYKLHIRAEAGDGLAPMLTPGKSGTGTYGAKFIQAYNNLTLEGIYVSNFTPDNKYVNRGIEILAKKARVVIDGCYLEGDRGGSIAVDADSTKIYMLNTHGGNIGHRVTYGGNGRILDFRNACFYVDTAVIQNCTNYNASDRIIRNMNTLVNYLLFDHNTIINNVGVHGALQLGKMRKAVITNNIFANTISLGHYPSRMTEQTQPEKYFTVITIDTTYKIPSPDITIRNNNIYHDQELKDVWAAHGDTVKVPKEITATLETLIGAGNVPKAWFAEPLTFTTFCGNLKDYVNAYLNTPTATSFPENWCVGGQGGYFADQLDGSYSNTSVSYTAADKYYPLGNLNYYPDLKTQWIAGVDLSATHAQLTDLKVGGTTVTGFASTTLVYDVALPTGTTVVPAVTYTLSDATSTVVQTDAAAIPGTTTVKVTTSDGLTSLEYKVNFSIATGIEKVDDNVVSSNYPNPFTNSTKINYDLKKSAKVELIILDYTGRKVNVLVNQPQSAGSYSIDWYGTNASGAKLPNGVYFYRLTTGENTITRAMIKQ